MIGLLQALFGGKGRDDGPEPGPVRVLYKRYDRKIDLTGRNLVLVLVAAGADRDVLKKEITILADPSEMDERWVSEDAAMARMTGKVADEIHEFKRAYQARSRLRRILLRDGYVIEVMFG